MLVFADLDYYTRGDSPYYWSGRLRQCLSLNPRLTEAFDSISVEAASTLAAVRVRVVIRASEEDADIEGRCERTMAAVFKACGVPANALIRGPQTYSA